MNSKLTITAIAAAADLVLAGCTSGSAPLAQSTDCTQAGVTCTHTDPPVAPVAPVAADPAPVAAPAPVASTCDVAREAILTGTPVSITAAMAALVADKTAPAIAREYAQYYTGRDAGQKDMQTMDTGLIQAACSA
jgi:hypothetical protein